MDSGKGTSLWEPNPRHNQAAIRKRQKHYLERASRGVNQGEESDLSLSRSGVSQGHLEGSQRVRANMVLDTLGVHFGHAFRNAQ
jgi:hypothetical protein